MRGSDIVDIAADLMPPRFRRVASLVVLVMVLLGGNRLVQWYINDKAAGLTEMYQPVIEDILQAVSPTVPPAAPDTPAVPGD